MAKRLSFQFNELIINRKLIESTLGFEDGLPEPFDSYIEQVWQFSTSLVDISAVFIILDNFMIEENKTTLFVENVEFKIGSIVGKEICNSERIAFFICTAGETICAKSKGLMQMETMCLGYVYDVMGTFIVEAVGDKIQEILAQEVSNYGNNITNRYSPGYCQWDVGEQHKLFSLFANGTCEVNLTPSGLMQPVKSISGIIGIGKNVKFRNYTCGICSIKNCFYQSIRKKGSTNNTNHEILDNPK
jgi:hypothetical protein